MQRSLHDKVSKLKTSEAQKYFGCLLSYSGTIAKPPCGTCHLTLSLAGSRRFAMDQTEADPLWSDSSGRLPRRPGPQLHRTPVDLADQWCSNANPRHPAEAAERRVPARC